MKQKRLISICMALLLMLSVISSTALPSFAAANSGTNTSSVRFVDADTGDEVPVDVAIAQSTGFISYKQILTAYHTASCSWTPSDTSGLVAAVLRAPQEYNLINNFFDIDAQDQSTLHEDVEILGDTAIIKLHKKPMEDNFALEFRSQYNNQMFEWKYLVWLLQGPETYALNYSSKMSFCLTEPGDYALVPFYYNNGNLELIDAEVVDFYFDGQAIEQLYPNNANAEITDQLLTYYVPSANNTLPPVNINFIAADTKAPVEVEWYLCPENTPEMIDWEMVREVSSGKSFVPELMLYYNMDSKYYLTLDSLPDGYVMPPRSVIPFYYLQSGIKADEFDYSLSNTTIDIETGTITVALERQKTAKPVTMQFQDRATGKPITPDSVSVTPRGGGALTNTFQKQGAVSFIPSYYEANQLSSGYDVAVQLAGYENVNLTDAFTYDGAITRSIGSDYISVNGNAITIKMDKTVPVDPEPEPAVNLLKNGDFEAVNIPNWYQRGSNPTVMQTNSQYRSGAYSLYMAYFKNEAFNNHIDQTCAVNQSGNYKFSAYIKTDAMLTGAGAMLTLEARDANGVLLSSNTSAVASNTNGGWQQLSMQMYAPPGTASIVAKIGGVYCTGGFYVDDAELIYQP